MGRRAVAWKSGRAQAQQLCEQVLRRGQVLLPALASCGGRCGELCWAVTAGPGWGPLRMALAGGCSVSRRGR